MSLDASPADATDCAVPPNAVSSTVTSESPDEYRAIHRVERDADTIEIRREVAVKGNRVTVTTEWVVREETVRTTTDDRPLSECVGESGEALSVMGFVCVIHFEPHPAEQFASVFAALDHGAV